MRILHLTLKKKWFDMICSGVKKEEYREIKPYWDKRLGLNKFDAVCFRHGYAKDAPKITFELERLDRGLGIIEWGAPEKKMVYILRLGKQLNL